MQNKILGPCVPNIWVKGAHFRYISKFFTLGPSLIALAVMKSLHCNWHYNQQPSSSLCLSLSTTAFIPVCLLPFKSQFLCLQFSFKLSCSHYKTLVKLIVLQYVHQKRQSSWHHPQSLRRAWGKRQWLKAIFLCLHPRAFRGSCRGVYSRPVLYVCGSMCMCVLQGWEAEVDGAMVM